MFIKHMKIEMAVEIVAKQGYWEATSKGIEIYAKGDTPDNAAKEFERQMKEGRPEAKARQVIQYVPKPKAEIAIAPEIEDPNDMVTEEVDTLAAETAEVKELEETKEVVFKKRGRPKKEIVNELVQEVDDALEL